MVTSQNSLSPFLRDKLFASIYDSVRHRKTALSDATALTDTIISKVWGSITDGQTSATLITKIAADILQRFDKAAAVYYSAYHPLDS